MGQGLNFKHDIFKKFFHCFFWLPTKEEEMETQKVTVSLSKNKKLESLIMTFFAKSVGMFECKNCSKLLRGYNFILKQHLKMKHEDLWNFYLSQIGLEMGKKANECGKPPEGTVCHVMSQ